MLRTLVTLSVFAGTLFGQRSVPAEYMYHRVWAVVPLVGSGGTGDPIRPMLVPLPSTAAQQPTAGPPDLLGYQMQVSDDGKFALVLRHEPVLRRLVVFALRSGPSGGGALLRREMQ